MKKKDKIRKVNTPPACTQAVPLIKLPRGQPHDQCLEYLPKILYTWVFLFFLMVFQNISFHMVSWTFIQN